MLGLAGGEAMGFAGGRAWVAAQVEAETLLYVAEHWFAHFFMLQLFVD